MENGREADDVAGGTVVMREEEPCTDADAAADAEVMLTPRSEIVDVGTPDALTPVMRGGGGGGNVAAKGFFAGEPQVFEEADQDGDAAAPPTSAAVAVEEDTGAYKDGTGGAGEDQLENAHDAPPLPPVSISGVKTYYETVPGSQAGQVQTSDSRPPASAAERSAFAPNTGEVTGGYDQGPVPEISAQQTEDDDDEVSSVPVAAPDAAEYHDRSMQIDDDGVQQNGKYQVQDMEDAREHDQPHENGLNNGDGEVLLVFEEPVSPPTQEDSVLPLEAVADTDDATEAISDVVTDDASPTQTEGTTTTLRSLHNGTGDDASGAADQNELYDRWSHFTPSPEHDREQDKVAVEAADVSSQLSESPPPNSDTPTVKISNRSAAEDEGHSSPAHSPPPPVAVDTADQKPSVTLQSHPSGLGSSAALPEPAATRAVQQQQQSRGSASHRQAQLSEDASVNGEVEEYDETREKLQMIRVKFLRLAHRLGQTPHNVVVAQVLYRLGLAEQLRGSMNTSRAGAFSFDRASALAEQLEAAGQEPLDFTCTIMVIGKTGVGKTATINSIFDEVRLKTDAFQMGTKKVQEIVGTVQGIKVRVIDTPGLLPSLFDQVRNHNILQSVKKFIKKNPPDVIMYLDRLDMQNRDLGDFPLLRTITNIFGPSVWFNAIVVLTHAASAPPEGANGAPLSYEMYVTQRTHVIQNAIRQAAGDPRLLNPVSLVENHSACRMNRAGQRVLPNGQVWKPHLLLLSFASKILTEANMLLKLQDTPAGRPFGARQRSPPLPFFLSSLLQSRPQVKLPDEQFGEDDAIDLDVDEDSESDDEPDYDELPPFKKLTKEQISRLSKAQNKAYFEELDYRERLFFKKQLKEEKKRRKLLKKMADEAKNTTDEYNNDTIDEENNSPATVPVPMHDMALPASFDSDYPTHRYRFLDTASQWIVRPVLETQGWDHDIGYEGVNVERLFVVRDKIPLSVSGQLTKDKKECTLQMEMASSVKHGEGKATSLGLDLQSIGKDMAYTLRGETRFTSFRRNSTAAGISATLLGDTLSAGLKIEDKLTVGKRFKMLVSGGAMSGRGDVAYGGRLEATLRDKDYPLGRQLSTLALSVVDWHGDLAVGCNLQSQIPVGRSTNMTAHASLNNRGTGQVGVRVNGSEQLLLALLALVPLLSNARKYIFGSSESM